MGIANYAYDWPSKAGLKAHEQAQSGKFSGSHRHGDGIGSAGSIRFRFAESALLLFGRAQHVHHVWMLDGVTAYNELRAAERAGVQGTALWRLGSEDPSVWSIWDATRPDDADRAKLEDMPPGYDLILEGDGDIWRFADTPQKGSRTIRFDPRPTRSSKTITNRFRRPIAFSRWAPRRIKSR